MDFIHLHVHSQYSFLDGASSLDKLLDKALSLRMPALALTDHNRLTGAIRFYNQARALGIKPIIGAEVDLAGGYHFTLLCKNADGYSNLCRLITQAHLSGRDRKPEATREMLRDHSSGLIALSGCSKGEIPAFVAEGKRDKAKEAACFYREVFGKDFFIELIRYPSREGASDSYRLASFAQEENLSVVATNNVHYVEIKEYRINLVDFEDMNNSPLSDGLRLQDKQ